MPQSSGPIFVTSYPISLSFSILIRLSLISSSDNDSFESIALNALGCVFYSPCY